MRDAPNLSALSNFLTQFGMAQRVREFGAALRVHFDRHLWPQRLPAPSAPVRATQPLAFALALARQGRRLVEHDQGKDNAGDNGGQRET